jgi:hypothetical protein
MTIMRAAELTPKLNDPCAPIAKIWQENMVDDLPQTSRNFNV